MIAPPRSLASPPSPRTAEAVEEVLSIAAEHAVLDPVKATMFRHEVRRLTSGKQRWVATLHSDPADPRRADLVALIDRLVDDQPGWQTGHGFLTRDVIAESAGLVTDGPDGRRVMRFPIVQPWRHKPDESGFGGERDEPIYRDVPAMETDDDAPPPQWWEAA